MPKLAIVLDQTELNGLQTPIIVEAWNRIGSRNGYGRGRREYLKEFTKQERRKVNRIYKMAYTWYLVTGTPQSKVFYSYSEIEFIQRVVAFFATH